MLCCLKKGILGKYNCWAHSFCGLWRHSLKDFAGLSLVRETNCSQVLTWTWDFLSFAPLFLLLPYAVQTPGMVLQVVCTKLLWHPIQQAPAEQALHPQQLRIITGRSHLCFPLPQPNFIRCLRVQKTIRGGRFHKRLHSHPQ